MDENQLAADFETHRTRLRAMAYRMLGSVHEADDAVQEAWLRLHRTDEVDNLGGWLTTVVSRVCLDMLRSRARRSEDELEATDVVLGDDEAGHPEHEAALADAVGAALLVVLETLSPAERMAFVLHDLFALDFDQVATILDRSPAAARQLASRARRRVQGSPEPDRTADASVVEAFLRAAKDGDFTSLLEMLDPDAEIRSDSFAAQMGSPALITGGNAVAEFFNGSAKAAHLLTIDGVPGAGWQHRGELKVAFSFTVTDGRVTEIEFVGNPETLASFAVGKFPA